MQKLRISYPLFAVVGVDNRVFVHFFKGQRRCFLRRQFEQFFHIHTHGTWRQRRCGFERWRNGYRICSHGCRCIVRIRWFRERSNGWGRGDYGFLPSRSGGLLLSRSESMCSSLSVRLAMRCHLRRKFSRCIWSIHWVAASDVTATTSTYWRWFQILVSGIFDDIVHNGYAMLMISLVVLGLIQEENIWMRTLALVENKRWHHHPGGGWRWLRWRKWSGANTSFCGPTFDCRCRFYNRRGAAALPPPYGG